ncbi:hypothetical protein L7F22_065570 [Adiantum nelumboides]|nr:hypothetical protein [Adiantum nelumboides]
MKVLKMREGTSTPMRRFPPAPHPEIMRADQKDSHYVNYLCEACHDAYSCVFVHRGMDATVKAVETFFYWPALRRDVDAFVRECIICQKVKFDRQKAPGLLQPLPIPDKPWESIAMDFIFDLPRTQTGNDGIWTIICRFSKQAHFIPVRKKIKPDQMARLFMSNIFKYHGMPQSIVSDRDPRMTSLLWRGLFENMGTTLKFSSSFHPQTDGQSEEANSTVLDLLKCYLSEHKGKWEQYLPLVEYAYNNSAFINWQSTF